MQPLPLLLEGPRRRRLVVIYLPRRDNWQSALMLQVGILELGFPP
jgi:hypothetical protein